MSHLYNVQLKIGKRSINTEFYASNHNNIITFVETYLEAKVVKIQEVVYDVRETATINPDDSSTYKGTMKFLARNSTASLMGRIVVPTVKISKTPDQVFEGMKSLLKLTKNHSIESLVSINISSK